MDADRFYTMEELDQMEVLHNIVLFFYTVGWFAVASLLAQGLR